MASNNKNLAELLNGDVTVTATDIADGSVTEAKIGSGAVTGDKIGDGEVVEAKIGSGAVTTAKIGDGEITGAKLTDSTVTADKLDVGQIGGRRNLIINGAMQVAQRGTSTTGVVGTGYYTVDRFEVDLNGLGAHTVSQSTDAPDGFSNSAKIEVTTADASPTTNDRLALVYYAEAQDLQGLAYGTSNAKTITLSFYVKSNKTGTFSNELIQEDNSSKHWSFDYTISSADTWEYKTITFTGDTSGVINNDNGSGLQIKLWLGAGPTYTSGTYTTGQWQARSAANAVSSSSPNVGDTIGNTWQITGVQLEVGTVATPFEHRSYGEELALCQRYYYEHVDANDNSQVIFTAWTTTAGYGVIYFPVTMRTGPTASSASPNDDFVFYSDGSSRGSVDTLAFDSLNPNSVRVYSESLSGMTAGYSGFMRIDNGSSVAFDAEL